MNSKESKNYDIYTFHFSHLALIASLHYSSINNYLSLPQKSCLRRWATRFPCHILKKFGIRLGKKVSPGDQFSGASSSGLSRFVERNLEMCGSCSATLSHLLLSFETQSSLIQ